VDRIRIDMDDPALDSLIQQDLADAATLGIRKTPGYLVNGKPLPSFGLKQLWNLVEAEIAAN
jgi:protein-disulfide isomerase